MSQSKDQFSEAETAKRRDEVLKHMLNTPPSPRVSPPKSRKKAGAGPKARKPSGRQQKT